MLSATAFSPVFYADLDAHELAARRIELGQLKRFHRAAGLHLDLLAVLSRQRGRLPERRRC
jgi:hypothetical protein